MKIKLNFPINMEMCFKNTGESVIGKTLPISVDGKCIGTGTIVDIKGFSITYIVDKEAEQNYRESFTPEELKSFVVEDKIVENKL